MAKRLMGTVSALGVAVLAMGLVAACSTDSDADDQQQIAGLQTRVGQLEEQLRSVQGQLAEAVARPTLMVTPDFFRYPEGSRGAGALWFYGSGLEADQWYGITIEGEGEVVNVDSLAHDALRQANAAGAFAVTLAAIRPDDGLPLDRDVGRRGGVLVAKLWDAETDALLASTPFVVCGSDGENPWCGAAHDSATAAEVQLVPTTPPGVVTVYTLGEFRLRDSLFELRMGDTTAWGYNAGDRIRSGLYEGAPGQDIVITVNAGDTLEFTDGFTGSSGNTLTHYLTIDEFGINEAVGPGEDTNLGFTLTPTEAGTYRIYCSAHPDDHGNVTLIVE